MSTNQTTLLAANPGRAADLYDEHSRDGLGDIVRDVHELLSPHAPRASTDEIDVHAQRILDGIDTGAVDEAEGRQLLSSLAFVSGIHKEVANRLRVKTPQARSDIADSLADLTMQKILSDAEGGYDVVRARGRSLCGYARNLQNAALMSKNRDHSRRDRHLSESDLRVSEDGPNTPGGVFERLGLMEATSSAEEQFIEATTEQASLEADPTTTANLLRVNISQEERIFFVAQRVSESLGVPYPLRPYDPEDRQWLAEHFREHPAAAAQSLTAYRDLVAGEVVGAVDERALSIWDNYSEAEAFALLGEASVNQIAALALSSVVDLVRPAKAVRQVMIRSLLSGQRPSSAWGVLVTGLVDSFLAREATASNPHYLHRQANAEELLAKRREEAGQWGRLVGEVIAFPGHPVGTDAQDVFERLVAVWRSSRATPV